MIKTVMDIETTGFYKLNEDKTTLLDSSEIVEVGYIQIDDTNFDIVNYGTLYFYKPYFNLENEAAAVHGLTREFLEPYEKDFDRNLIALCSLMENCVMIGKNNRNFDLPYIQSFIKKHAKFDTNIPALVAGLNMKDYNDHKFYYGSSVTVIDTQELYMPIWRSIQFAKTGETTRKWGTLGQYIESIDGGQQLTQEFYDSLEKARVTGAHGALYDCCMTLVIYLWYLGWEASYLEYNKTPEQIAEELKKIDSKTARGEYLLNEIQNGCDYDTMLDGCELYSGVKYTRYN